MMVACLCTHQHNRTPHRIQSNRINITVDSTLMQRRLSSISQHTVSHSALWNICNLYTYIFQWSMFERNPIFKYVLNWNWIPLWFCECRVGLVSIESFCLFSRETQRCAADVIVGCALVYCCHCSRHSHRMNSWQHFGEHFDLRPQLFVVRYCVCVCVCCSFYRFIDDDTNATITL